MVFNPDISINTAQMCQPKYRKSVYQTLINPNVTAYSTFWKKHTKYYRPRISDEQLKLKLETSGTTFIVGLKGCEKTATTKQHANSYIEFQDEDQRDNYLLIANKHPSD